MAKEEFKRRLVEEGFLTEDWINIAAVEKLPDILKSIVGTAFYPESKSIFRALKGCPYDKLSVVILGQDPYHDGSATGLAFDNLRSQRKISPSLRKILREMDSDIGMSKADITDSHLGHLPAQGVLLLNTALTVESGKPGSHTELWAPFTEQLVKDLQEKDNLVWILWGNHAKSFKEFITNKTHYVIEGTHPAARPGVKIPFENGKYFSRCNDFLNSINKHQIAW